MSIPAARPTEKSAPSSPLKRLGALFKARPLVPAILLLVFLALMGGWAYQLWQNRHVLILYGNVDIRESNIGFRVSGRLQKLLKDEGDQVKGGDLLAELDPVPAQHDLDEAQANVELEEAAVENAESNFRRAQSLVGTKGISQQEYDTFQVTLNQSKASLDLMKARLAAAQTRLEDTRLVSPAEGVVITRAQEAGTILEPGSTVFTLSLEKPVWVRAYIEESSLGNVHPGKEVTISSDSFPDRVFHGQVGYISPRAEFTPKSVETKSLRTALVYRIRITVTDPDAGLRQGMPITVRIPLP